VFGGPPWLFPRQADAAAYTAQLQAAGTPAEVRAWQAAVTTWEGRCLIVHPPLPTPELAADAVQTPQPNGEASSDHDDGLPPPPEA